MVFQKHKNEEENDKQNHLKQFPKTQRNVSLQLKGLLDAYCKDKKMLVSENVAAVLKNTEERRVNKLPASRWGEENVT